MEIKEVDRDHAAPGEREAERSARPSVYDFSARRLDGSVQSLADYRGQVLLIVNTASRCGFTPQYAGLQKLYDACKDRGLVVLGFPCNQFAGQEPGDEREIAAFCEINYGVAFPLFAKVDVNGSHAHPLYEYLKAARRGAFWTEAIKWNFTKFLIDARGKPVKRYGPLTKPEKIRADVERQLARR